MSLKIKISEKEILDNPNDAVLGSHVRTKYLIHKKHTQEDNSLSMGQIPDYDSFDKCILCGVETPYTISTSIDYRIGYVEGVGQLCNYCVKK
jgi:hypothetical protein